MQRHSIAELAVSDHRKLRGIARLADLVYRGRA